MKNVTIIKNIAESIRKRPAMYIGNHGLLGYFYNLIVEFIRESNNSKFLWKLIIRKEGEYIITISDLQNKEILLNDFFDFQILEGLCIPKKFRISLSNTQIDIHFFIDSTISSILPISVDYWSLSNKMLQLASLYQGVEILLIDETKKYIQQNYFHIPEGIFYYFEREYLNALKKPTFKLKIRENIEEQKYQIGLAYREDWFPEPNILSFANHRNTIYHGTLVDGIINGLIEGCKKFTKKHHMNNHVIHKDRVWNGLILVCFINGDNLCFGGSFGESLEDQKVKIEAKKIVCKAVLNYLETHSEIAHKFLHRFNNSIITTSMFSSK